MKLDVPDEYLPLIVKALETMYAYTRTKNTDDYRYQEAAEFFKIKSASKEERQPARAKRKA